MSASSSGSELTHTIAQRLDAAIAEHEAGRIEAAERMYREVLDASPESPEALHLLGLALHQQARHSEGRQLIERALAARPDSALFHFNLGNVLLALEDPEGAAGEFEQAVHLRPDHLYGWANLGKTRALLGDWLSAVHAFRNALAINSTISVHFELAAAIARIADESPDASKLWDECIQLAQTHLREAEDRAAGLALLGHALEKRSRWTEAVERYRELLMISPAQPQVLASVGNCLTLMGCAAEAAEYYRRAFEGGPGSHHPMVALIGALNFDPGLSPAELLAAHQGFAETLAQPLYPRTPAVIGERSPERPLKVGYVSPDLYAHPVGLLFAPIVERHDPARVSACIYYTNSRADAVTARIRTASRLWRDAQGLSDEALAAQIRADGVDILVDMAGFTRFSPVLVFARRPAPVQVSWLGYFASTGLATMDWFISDEHSSPPGQEPLFTERLLRVGPTRFCYEPPAYMPPVSPPPMDRNGFVTFGCCNNLNKVNADVTAAWSDILAAVPRSRLVLQTFAFNDPLNRVRVTKLFDQAGIHPSRLELRAAVPADRSPEVYHDIDIALDPFPFSGGMTSFDALWMGVPVVTIAGVSLAGRQSAALLYNLGLPELCTASPAQYVECASALARDPARLAALRTGMRARMRASPLMDYEALCRRLENAFRHMWRESLSEVA